MSTNSLNAKRDCTFCAIVAGVIPAKIFYEDEHALAFMDRLPMTTGHCLVIPKRHATDIFELTDDDAAHVFQAACNVARLVRRKLAPLGVNILNNNGRHAHQTQFHFHIHVVPRYGGDRLLHPSERYEFGAPPHEIDLAYEALVGDGENLGTNAARRN